MRRVGAFRRCGALLWPERRRFTERNRDGHDQRRDSGRSFNLDERGDRTKPHGKGRFRRRIQHHDYFAGPV